MIGGFKAGTKLAEIPNRFTIQCEFKCIEINGWLLNERPEIFYFCGKLKNQNIMAADGFFKISKPNNEPFLSYAPGTPEKKELKQEIKKCYSEVREVPMIINGKEVKTNDIRESRPPHRLN
ncbi:MAG: hypothetical protein BRD49_02615, partial [Bacteroidetes bacterium SW_10_40_5]